jgi:hypothetical protein
VSDQERELYYSEKVPIQQIVGFLILMVIILLVYLSVTIPGGVPQKVMVFIILFTGFIYGTFMTLDVTIDSERLRVAYSFIKYSVRLDNISEVEIRKPAWYWYGGFGIRFGWDLSIGFLQNFREGVLIIPKKGRKLFFSTNNPEAVANILQDLVQKSYWG